MIRAHRIALGILFVGAVIFTQTEPVYAQCTPPNLCPTTTGPPCVNPSFSCEITDLVFTNATTLIWMTPGPCSTLPLFDVAKGDLNALHDTCEPVSSTCDSCLGEDVAAPPVIDAGTPAIGTGWWYLVRADDGPANSVGSYNSMSLNQCSDYDPGSAASCAP